MEIGIFRIVDVAFGNAILDSSDHNKSKVGVLETHTVTLTDQSTVKNTFWNLSFEVTKHIQLIGRSKIRNDSLAY
jgi:hypothetical protein